MGSILDYSSGHSQRQDGPFQEPFMSFKLVGLASGQPTGMRDEVLLLSWLSVLLRTREDRQFLFDWAHQSWQDDVANEFETRSLSVNEVVMDLRNPVDQTAGDLLPRIAATVPSPSTAATNSISLLFSTGSLSRQSADARDEAILHLETRFLDDRLEIRPTWWTENMLPYTIRRYIENLVETVRICLAHPSIPVADLTRPTESDIGEIWRWNHQLPPVYDFCMHDMVSERARDLPDKVAISSWDGNLTYGQIDRYSTLVASSLRQMGVKLHDVLPICFEKSRWTIVAVLAAMKSGATFVLMDPTLPLARLQNVATQVGAEAMLTSRMQQELSTAIIPNERQIVVEAELFANMPNLQTIAPLPAVPSSALMYMIFTSGSTGTPKGVKISHATYTSSAIPRAKAVGYTEESRVLDFASYAFDVSIDSMLLTLGNGGCLCIPSDEDRLNDINEVIRKMRVNYAGLTPSVARILDPDVIASLSGLGLGGEAASARDVTVWGQDTRIIIGYGPCECTIGCTVNSSAATGRDYISIGPGNGAAIWVVDPNDHELLMPVGAVGELLVEGPIVGQGYLNDPDKTAAAFIEDPSWLLAGHKDYQGRRGRLYKTGDLGKYDPDGSGGIVFAGRKDTQVKLRGQRVELGEIESQLRAILPSDTSVIAEVIVPQGSGGQPTLVAFVASQSQKGQKCAEIQSVQLSDELRHSLPNANAQLAKVLPRYMVPTAYIPVTYIPVLISGKIDRKRLRQFGTSVDLRQLEDEGSTASSSRELSELEQRLREIWGQVLKLEPETIRLEDNFFALGGDSVAAMRLVSACRASGLDLSVVGTFSNPTLSGMAGVVHIRDSEAQTEALPFSMITQDKDSACLEAARICGSSPGDIKDIYPCTPTQESLFTFSLKSSKAYVAQRVACIPPHIILDDWKRAWEAVATASPILRTRLVQLQDPGLQQVVLEEEIMWGHSTDLLQYLQNDRDEKMNLGERLARYAIIDHSDEGKRYMVWTVHHVLYDGWSEPQILNQVSQALEGHPIQLHAQMRDFVKYVRETDETATKEFWKRELNQAVGPQFPRLPSRDFLPTPDGMLEHQIPLDMGANWPFTVATLIRGAWALLASKYTGSDDVVFGETLTGRDISLSGVESIIGPLIATVPVRIRVHREISVESYLQAVQQTMLTRTPYQHMGMQYIRKVSRDAQYACEAPTGLVIQPEPDLAAGELGFSAGDVVREALHFNPYPLMLACGIQKGGFRICASFDSSLIEMEQMRRVLHQLEMVCLQLTKSLSRPVQDIPCLPETELNLIWERNEFGPLSLNTSSGLLQADAGLTHGSDYPLAAVPWVCDPHNVSLLSPIGCIGELWLEGNFLTGETVDSPPWLVAGSSAGVGRTGKLQATGDVVQLQGDGKMVFLGRKADVLPVQGHAVNIAELEAHVARHLPPAVQAAATMLESFAGSQHSPAPGLVVFIGCRIPAEENVQLLPTDHDIMADTSDHKLTICGTVPVSVVVALRRLDRFIRDSLPSYMIPSTYIVVDEIPATTGLVDRGLMYQLASCIPRKILAELGAAFEKAWTHSATQTNLSPAENILRSSWAKILGISAEKIDVDDNFFRLGGDSVLAMKLIFSLRTQGHGLTVADIFQHMRLGDAAQVLKIGQASTGRARSYQPFSTIGPIEVGKFLSDVVQPKLSNSSWLVQDVSPVTDSQALDVRATIQRPRTSIQYNMLYFNQGVDRDQLYRACQRLVDSHEILRTVFVEHNSTLFQVVVKTLDVPVTTHHIDEGLEQYVADLCTAHIESDFNLGSSFVAMFHVEASDGRSCLVIGLSHAQYDGISLPRLLRDLDTLYMGQEIEQSEPFSSYVARVRDVHDHADALKYWHGLLAGSTLSVLGGSLGQPTDKAIFHTKPVEISQTLKEITTANLLTAAWALTLARRLRTSDVTFGGVTSGRNVDVANVESVMGPCYQLTPIRVPFQSQWTAMDLLRFVQKQSGQSAAHDYLGFRAISEECTQWPSEVSSFDSLVHHQDFEDFDTMPFAGGTCRVDILNPHGDAAYPLKVVSFVRSGKMHVGLVGSERDTALVDAVLEELTSTVEELATYSSEPLNVLG
ncbi:nonribosomal peptide synthase SidD [Aspergillus melleus]|uniref:nonribosomal peptide synthase SidD n=1 Tax=Aspergillus melleus TaxID=138277 RepID=UPI001E8E2F97|nr:Nonribosomal peptide synthetase 4 [Aspergillus melleus]KAH8427277.1 Nonribosomal peptide synthetase 4 [Aspergillus melleus]